LRVVAPRRTVVEHIRELFGYGELTSTLIRKELKVRYKNSVLGLTWSMIQPLFLLIIYSIAFSVLGGGLARLGIWIMSGLLVWGLVGTSVSTATQSITGNGQLVSKVRFPRAVLPIASIGAALVHFAVQTGMFLVVLLVVRQGVEWSFVWLIPLALVAMVLFLFAVCLLLSAMNVYARDTQHLLDLLLLGWFWLTPIVYTYGLVEQKLIEHDLPTWLPLVNPLTPVVMTFQRILYGTPSINGQRLLPDTSALWYARNLAIVAVISVGLCVAALRLFDRAEANMAEAI
jgi:ABC-2 type transport system permease protein